MSRLSRRDSITAAAAGTVGVLADRTRSATGAPIPSERIFLNEVEWVERHGFESDTIARREELLESVAESHVLEFRPYGGTLMEPPWSDHGKPPAGENLRYRTVLKPHPGGLLTCPKC